MSKGEVISTISKNRYIHFYKKVKYNTSARYKSVSYWYDILDGEEVKETKRHNIHKKPALIYYNGNKITRLEYWYKGERHRMYAPAILELDGKEIIIEEWYHGGKKLSDSEIEHEKKVMFRRTKVLKLMIRMYNKKRGLI